MIFMEARDTKALASRSRNDGLLPEMRLILIDV